jgi:hypothetical protein
MYYALVDATRVVMHAERNDDDAPPYTLLRSSETVRMAYIDGLRHAWLLLREIDPEGFKRADDALVRAEGRPKDEAL